MIWLIIYYILTPASFIILILVFLSILENTKQAKKIEKERKEKEKEIIKKIEEILKENKK